MTLGFRHCAVTLLLFIPPTIGIGSGPPELPGGNDDKLAGLEKTVEKLQQEVADLRAMIADRVGAPRRADPVTAIVHSRLDVIKLSENPIRDEIAHYVEAIIVASRGQHSFSGSDRQIAMFAAVGRKHLDVLIDGLDRYGDTHGLSGGNYHLMPAVDMLATDRDRDLILKNLPRHHGLVSLVLSHGWEKQAQSTLIAELDHARRFIAPDWIGAIARLEDPTTFDALKEHFVLGSSKVAVHDILKRLPGIDLREAVRQAWRNSSDLESWDKEDVATVAVEYGHVDALAYLAETVLKPPDRHRSYESRHYSLVWHVPNKGTIRETAKWILQNEARLKFDKDSKRYFIED